MRLASGEIYWESSGVKHHVDRCNMCGDPCDNWVEVDQSYTDALETGADFVCSQLAEAPCTLIGMCAHMHVFVDARILVHVLVYPYIFTFSYISMFELVHASTLYTVDRHIKKYHDFDEYSNYS